MPHTLRAALLVCLCLPAAAGALTFEFSGSIEGVRDDLDSLDASVVIGAPVSGIYQVELTTASTGSPFELGPAQLSFSLGASPTYLFSASQTAHAIALINDRVVLSTTVDLWQSREISTSDLSPATTNHGSAFAGYAAQIEFNDFGAAVFDGSETEPFVPGDVAGWDQVQLRLTRLEQNGAGPPIFDNRVQVGVNITNWMLIPEPHSAALFAFGLASLASLAHRARRRARAR